MATHSFQERGEGIQLGLAGDDGKPFLAHHVIEQPREGFLSRAGQESLHPAPFRDRQMWHEPGQLCPRERSVSGSGRAIADSRHRAAKVIDGCTVVGFDHGLLMLRLSARPATSWSTIFGAEPKTQPCSYSIRISATSSSTCLVQNSIAKR